MAEEDTRQAAERIRVSVEVLLAGLRTLEEALSGHKDQMGESADSFRRSSLGRF